MTIRTKTPIPISEKSIVPLLIEDRKPDDSVWDAVGPPTVVADVTGAVICPFGRVVTGRDLADVLIGGVIVGWVAISV